jgi:hypothetical protein
MATRETAAADSNMSGRRRCNRATAMVLQGRDGETQVVSEQIQRGCKRAMETCATAIKAGQRRHKWAMVQAAATVMYCKGSSFYNSIINKDGPRMLARRRDNNERQFKSLPSLNTVSLRRISCFSEIHSPRSVTPFFFQNAPFPPKSNKTAPAAKPLSACLYIIFNVPQQLAEFGRVTPRPHIECIILESNYGTLVIQLCGRSSSCKRTMVSFFLPSPPGDLIFRSAMIN